jgi:hypothetical protein
VTDLTLIKDTPRAPYNGQPLTTAR